MKFLWKILIFILILICAGFVYQNLVTRPIDQGMDIYYSWVEGARLLKGENPYERVLMGDMRSNDKYATYFPLFYILSFLSQRAGFLGLDEWLGLWRIVFILFNFAIAALIYCYLLRRELILLAVVATMFWLMNRWTLYQVRVAYFDFIPIFFMILAVILFPRRKKLSLLAMSFSLAFKQMAIFLVPLFLIWIWQDSQDNRWRHLISGIFLLGLVPLITSLPFLFWNAVGFLRSIFFSVTRDAADHFGSPVLSFYMNWEGITARLPMLAMMGLVYLAAWKKQVGKNIGALLAMLMFLEFNPVQFRQYFSWVMVFLPFVLVDISSNDNTSHVDA
jgi:hypothetical protein